VQAASSAPQVQAALQVYKVLRAQALLAPLASKVQPVFKEQLEPVVLRVQLAYLELRVPQVLLEQLV
jgi:hypothetical protein